MGQNLREAFSANRLGILDFEIYTPKLFVEQTDLERAMAEIDPSGNYHGKFTVGIGQTRMGFCTLLEDTVSMALTVTNRFLARTDIDLNLIGRIDVGSESNIDKSKSIKSHLMQLFNLSGSRNIEGSDCINACYGGCAALLNVLNWAESSASLSGNFTVNHGHKYGLVVCSDVAIYPANCSAFATGGAGAILLLIGYDAPIHFDLFKAHFSDHVYDFYKPTCYNSEYPLFDARSTVICYLTSVVKCCEQFLLNDMDIDLDFNIFHSPYAKLVEKANVYMLFVMNSFVNEKWGHLKSFTERIEFLKNIWEDPAKTRSFEKELFSCFKEKLKNSSSALIFSKNIGNTYCASVFISLFSFLSNFKYTNGNVGGNKHEQKKGTLFSYGSGSISSMLIVNFDCHSKKFQQLQQHCQHVQKMFDERIPQSFKEYSNLVGQRKLFSKLQLESTPNQTYIITPENLLADINQNIQNKMHNLNNFISKNTFYLSHITDDLRRVYKNFN